MRYFVAMSVKHEEKRGRLIMMFTSKADRDRFVSASPNTRKPTTRAHITSFLKPLKPFGAEYWGASKEGVPESIAKEFPAAYRVTRCKKGSGVPSVDSGIFL